MIIGAAGWRGRGVFIAFCVTALAATASCSYGTKKSAPSVKNTSYGPFTLSIGPAINAKNQSVASEISTKVTNGHVDKVELAAAGGRTVPGQMRDDGTSWVPAKALDFNTSYTASVTAIGDNGQTETQTTRFTTMSDPGSVRVGTGLYLFSGQTYGVGMPVVVEFDETIPEKARASVERRLFVKSDPPQAGVWHWYGGNQVLYRPRDYWLPGTKLTVRIAVQGLPMGTGHYGDVDRTASVVIGNKVFLDVNNATKQMTAYIDNKPVRTMPVSLGKPSTPSSSGNMVIMTKEYSTVFDTTREGPGGYRVNINYAMRLTWGGEFIHAAPWSVADQGHTNVSHGCVNMSWDNAEWVFNHSHIGDLVTVRGTEVRLAPGNGWTVWDMSWDEYIKGSALSHPDLAAAAAPDAGGSPDPQAGPQMSGTHN